MNKLILPLITMILFSCNEDKTSKKEIPSPAPTIIKEEVEESIIPPAQYDVSRKKDEIICKTLNGDLKLELLYGKKEFMDEEVVLGYSQMWSMEETPVRIPQPGIHFLDHTEDSHCTLHAGYLIEDKYILIPGNSSSPPHDDILSLFVFDYKTRKLVTKKSFKQSLYNNMASIPPVTVRNIDGISYQSWTGRSDATSVNVKHRGETAEAKEVDLVKWIKITFMDGILSDSLDRKKTWERSTFKKYFKSQDDFEKAFDLSKDKQSYNNDSVFLEAKFTSFSCVMPKSEREKDDGDWYCDDFKTE